MPVNLSHILMLISSLRPVSLFHCHIFHNVWPMPRQIYTQLFHSSRCDSWSSYPPSCFYWKFYIPLWCWFLTVVQSVISVIRFVIIMQTCSLTYFKFQPCGLANPPSVLSDMSYRIWYYRKCYRYFWIHWGHIVTLEVDLSWLHAWHQNSGHIWPGIRILWQSKGSFWLWFNILARENKVSTSISGEINKGLSVWGLLSVNKLAGLMRAGYVIRDVCCLMHP